MLSFQPQIVSRELLVGLPERSRRVLTDRFGLAGSNARRTLDAIGKEYGITRERVRQIENHGIALIRTSDTYSKYQVIWDDLKEVVSVLGAVASEERLLIELSQDESEHNYLVFLLAVGHYFEGRRGDNNFHTRWSIDDQLARRVERSLAQMHETIQADHVLPEEEILQTFAKHLKQEGVRHRVEDETLAHWLLISKRLGKNPLGEWGRADSPHVRIKNTRDFAYLTVKRHGSPMHFNEVAKSITQLFNRPAHSATTHNELIKDKRFVLVGRGLYALKEWGYQPGVVRDVVRAILEREGPLTREEIVDRVKRERYVKDATIAVNLQNGPFVRLPDGKYTTVQLAQQMQ